MTGKIALIFTLLVFLIVVCFQYILKETFVAPYIMSSNTTSIPTSYSIPTSISTQTNPVLITEPSYTLHSIDHRHSLNHSKHHPVGVSIY